MVHAIYVVQISIYKKKQPILMSQVENRKHCLRKISIKCIPIRFIVSKDLVVEFREQRSGIVMNRSINKGA